ncbi:hypothetical protein KM043_010684 [Ampulex compressa]|nr:hypothetical protein KM043_010684 [Ampulex compressa]
MMQYAKYLCSLNLVGLANHVAENITSGDAHNDCGFSQLFKWRSFKIGFEEAKKSKKPIFLLIQETTCNTCQELKCKLSKSIKLIDLSSQFVMIHIQNNDAPVATQKVYQPDGKYVPRILFFTSKGELIKEVYNKHPQASEEHKYFYNNPTQIIDSMLIVLNHYSKR